MVDERRGVAIFRLSLGVLEYPVVSIAIDGPFGFVYLPVPVGVAPALGWMDPSDKAAKGMSQLLWSVVKDSESEEAEDESGDEGIRS